MSLPVDHSPQTAYLHPAQSCAAASIFLQLYLKPLVLMSFSRSLFQVFFGRCLLLWPCSVHCNAVIISSQCVSSQFHFLLLNSSSAASCFCPCLETDITETSQFGMCYSFNKRRSMWGDGFGNRNSN